MSTFFRIFNLLRNLISTIFYLFGYLFFGILIASPTFEAVDAQGNPTGEEMGVGGFVFIFSIFIFTPILIGFIIGHKKGVHLLVLTCITILMVVFFASPEFYQIFGQNLLQIFISFTIISFLLFGVATYSTYTRLVKLDENIKQDWSNIEIAYTKRVDTVTELIRH